jgi:2-oxoglutarate dehydrogenase E1 component
MKRIGDKYRMADFAWVQDEPENQGAGQFVVMEAKTAGIKNLAVISRPRSASPATGSSKRSQAEAQIILDRALSE